MELEEAIKEMKSLSPSEDAIKIILYELESYKERYKIAIEQNVKDYKNSIPKKKIEDKIEKLKQQKVQLPVEHMKKAQIKILQELLEEKMNDLTEKEALYILRHRKEYKDSEIDKAINKVKRINSHRNEYIKRYKKRLKESIPKKKIEDKKQWLKENILENDYASDLDKDIAEYQVIVLEQILEDK